MNFYIRIELTPEHINNSVLFFWCIIQYTEIGPSNCGHGWSSSITQACQDAELYYYKLIHPHK